MRSEALFPIQVLSKYGASIGQALGSCTMHLSARISGENSHTEKGTHKRYPKVVPETGNSAANNNR